MGKRSRKRPARSEKDRVGCMWGLINMFDFRQSHSTTKLLSDRKQGSGRHVGTKCSRSKLDLQSNFEDTQEEVDDVDESRADVNLVRTSVKTLILEEMSKVHRSKKIPSEEVERIRSELGLEDHLEKNYKQSTKNFKVAPHLVNDLRAPASLESHQSNCMNPAERSSLNFDLAAFMINFYGDNHQCQEKHVDRKGKIDSCAGLKTVDHGKHAHLEVPDSKLAEKQIMLHEVLADVFPSQKFIDMNHLNGAVQSKEFTDALEMRNSNKEILLNLIQDPNSLLLKQIQDYQSPQVGKLSQLESGKYLEANSLLEDIGSSGQCEEPINHKMFIKQSGYNFFRKKDRSKGTKPSRGSDSSHALNKIVVLKPTPARVLNASITISPSSSPQSHHSAKCLEDGERVFSHFSLKEIKRRLRHVIGESRKDRHIISMDGILHRIPYGSKDSDDSGKQTAGDSVGKGLASKSYCNAEHTSQSSTVIQKRDKKAKPKESQQNIKNENYFLKVDNDERLSIEATAHPLNSESFYEEVKKHLAEMLDTGDDDDILPTRQVSKSLGRLLSLPEYVLSPSFSPGRDKGPDRSLIQQFKQENATSYLSPLIQDLERTSCMDPALIDIQTKVGICIGEDLNQKGSTEIVEEADFISKEKCDQLDVHSESDGNEPGVISERCDEDISPTQPGLDDRSLEEKSPATPCVSISPSSLLEQNMKDPESILEKPERPSPISVLEPFFSEDVNSPGSTIAELPICHQSIHFEEHDNPAVVLTSSDPEANPRTCVNDNAGRFEYVRAVLNISGLSCNEISNRWLSSDQLLDPSLFDEVGISYSQLSDDPKLLFDCISEALEEIQERLFSCTPWVSFIKPNVRPFPIAGNLIQEVCKGIERHLQWPSLRTLDPIVRKDMEGGTWMDLRSETESIVIEMGDAILEDLMEETALKMCGFVNSQFSGLPSFCS